MRRALPLVALVALAAALAGCGATPGNGSDAKPTVPPVRLAGLLPTAPGLRDAEPATAAGAAAVQAALADKADAASARQLTQLGLQRGAIRTWTTAGGGKMTVVISVWNDHTAATSVGGDAAELVLGSSGATAWTPQQLSASRGAKVDAPGRRIRTLSFAVNATDLFVRAEGPVPDDVIIRAMQRMIAALGGGEAPTG